VSAAAAKRTVLAAASVAAVLATAVVGPAGGAPKFAKEKGLRDKVAPTAPANPHVVKATPSLVYVAWDPSSDDLGVAGYMVYGDGRPAVAASSSFVVSTLDCGESTDLTIIAFDRAGNRSPRVTTTVSTAACPDTQAPTTPNGFTQGATTENAVILNWTPSVDNVGVVNYGVYRNLVRIATTAAPTVTLTGLSCGRTYDYMLDAGDASGNRSDLSAAFVRTASCSDSTPPSQPANLSVSGRTESSLALSWSPSTDDVGVVGYHVSVNGSPTLTLTQTSANIANLVCDRTYNLGVDGYDAAGNRSVPASVSGTTAACAVAAPPPPAGDTTPPSTPTGLAASGVTQSGLNLNWNASTDNVAVTGYDVYRNGAKVASGSSTSAAQSGLSCGTAYAFGVVAHDAAGNSSQPAQLSAATAACAAPAPPPPAGDTTPPSQPGSFRITGSTATAINLAWNPSTDNVGVAGYRIYRNGVAGATTTQTSSSVSGLSCGSAYTFDVDAYDAAGNRSTKASLVGSTSACADTQAPSTPANVSASSRTATSIALGWSASTDNVGVVGYGLYRNGALVGTSATTTGIFSGLACNTNYTLALDAYDAAGNRSAKTTTMVATTACPDTTPPSTPTGLAASNVTSTGLTLGWNASTDNVGVSGYDVYRNGTKMATVTSTSSAQTGLSCGTSYSFGVVARDAAGNSSPQAPLTPQTSACAPPPPPTPSPITYVSNVAIGLNVGNDPKPEWDDYVISNTGDSGVIMGPVAGDPATALRRFDISGVGAGPNQPPWPVHGIYCKRPNTLLEDIKVRMAASPESRDALTLRRHGITVNRFDVDSVTDFATSYFEEDSIGGVVTLSNGVASAPSGYGMWVGLNTASVVRQKFVFSNVNFTIGGSNPKIIGVDPSEYVGPGVELHNVTLNGQPATAAMVQGMPVISIS
jgi:chitodextrinase